MRLDVVLGFVVTLVAAYLGARSQIVVDVARPDLSHYFFERSDGVTGNLLCHMRLVHDVVLALRNFKPLCSVIARRCVTEKLGLYPAHEDVFCLSHWQAVVIVHGDSPALNKFDVYTRAVEGTPRVTSLEELQVRGLVRRLEERAGPAHPVPRR